MAEKLLAGLDILVIEDDALLRKQIAAHLQGLGAEVGSASTLASARQSLAGLPADFALLDLQLPDGRGTQLLQEKAFSPNTGVIVMTADGGVAGAVECMRLGALDYLVKPFDVAELPLVISRARTQRQSRRIEQHRREGQEPLYFGSSLAGLFGQLEKILAADARMKEHLPPVLIEGETGTGKTAIARWLHHHGPRADQPLVEINCPAVPESLAESELFGHERGAFTDARAARIGLFEAASGGSLFLDELPSLSLGLQAKVLKALEDHRIRRLGGTREIPIDSRIIAATNQDLRQLVSHGLFREDLLHRLDLYRLRIPPVREWGPDLLKLAEALLDRLGRRHRLPGRRLSKAGQRALAQHTWPGNIRELAHELERALVFEQGEELDLLSVQAPVGQAGSRDLFESVFSPQFRFPEQGFDLEEFISQLIGRALQQTNNNVSAAARMLGVTRDYLRYRLSTGKSREE